MEGEGAKLLCPSENHCTNGPHSLATAHRKKEKHPVAVSEKIGPPGSSVWPLSFLTVLWSRCTFQEVCLRSAFFGKVRLSFAGTLSLPPQLLFSSSSSCFPGSGRSPRCQAVPPISKGTLCNHTGCNMPGRWGMVFMAGPQSKNARTAVCFGEPACCTLDQGFAPH